ncbi:hypothetical protein LSE82_001530 [Salmonella enterica]|nr:hypothetical protein [Salmonella enterica]
MKNKRPKGKGTLRVPAQSQTQTEEATAPEANELTDDIDTDMDDLSTLLPPSPEPE